MINLLIGMNTILLLFISILHFYWAFGGNWGIEYTIPEKHKNSFFDPKNKAKIMFATIIVAFGLLLFSLTIFSNYQPILPFLNQSWIINLTRIIGVIFLLRAIGDFNYFGLFKKQATSMFAQKDNQIFVPLCLFLGINSLIITF